MAKFSEALVSNLEERFKGFSEERKSYLRLSNVGRPLRQLWFDVKSGVRPEKLSAETKLKFLFGDILEDLLILLAIEAGHTVEDLQKKVEVDGVEGSIDCRIDGVLVDVKSASTRSFAKFKDGSLREDDPFGYIGQLAGYSAGMGGIDGAFLVVDKTLGKLCLLRINSPELARYRVRQRISQARVVLSRNTPPEEMCYEDVPDGKSGNMKLGVGCSYCAWKHHCRPNLRTFMYSNGPVFLTRVVNLPRVFEYKGDHGQHDK